MSRLEIFCLDIELCQAKMSGGENQLKDQIILFTNDLYIVVQSLYSAAKKNGSMFYGQQHTKFIQSYKKGLIKGTQTNYEKFLS